MPRGEVRHEGSEEVRRVVSVHVPPAAPTRLALVVLRGGQGEPGQESVDVVGHRLDHVGTSAQVVEELHHGIPLVLVVSVAAELADQRDLCVVAEPIGGYLLAARSQAPDWGRRRDREGIGERRWRGGVGQGQGQGHDAFGRALAAIDDLGCPNGVGQELGVDAADHHRQQGAMHGDGVAQLGPASLGGDGIRAGDEDEEIAVADPLQDHLPPELPALHLLVEPGRVTGPLDVGVQGGDRLDIPPRVADEDAHRSPLRGCLSCLLEREAGPQIHLSSCALSHRSQSVSVAERIR